VATAQIGAGVDQPCGILVRQRTQQHGVRDAEDGGAGPDSQRDRDHRRSGEGRARAERSRGVDEISERGFTCPRILQTQQRVQRLARNWPDLFEFRFVLSPTGCGQKCPLSPKLLQDGLGAWQK
jgi:hypothetical protein